MDALDIRIVRTMGLVPYQRSPQGPDALKAAHIARALGVTAETVRERVSRLEDAGVIAGYEVFPNLRHLGLEASAHLFVIDDDERRSRFSKDVEGVDGIIEVTYFLGPEVCVDLAYRTLAERDRKIGALMRIAQGDAPRDFFGWGMPPVERALTNLDWRVIRTLRGRARRPLPEVAAEIGVSYRTAKRHYDRMAEEGSLFVTPLVDPSRDPGLVPVALLFFFAEGAGPETVNAIRRAYDDQLIFSQAPLSPAFGNFDVLAFAATTGEVERMRQRGLSIPGVDRVAALVLADKSVHAGWIDDLIEQRIRETAPRAVGSP